MSLNRNLSKAVVTVSAMSTVAAGTSNQTSSSIDTRGATTVRWIASLGTLTASQVTKLKVQESDDNATWSDVTGAETPAMADADSNKLLIVDIYKPQKRYQQAIVERATANAVINGVIAELYLEDFQPVTQDASVSQVVYLDNPA